MEKRVAFVTIGQSPRPDMVPEILAETRTPIAASERGVLDGMDLPAVRALAPRGAEECLVSRMRDGTEVFLAKPAVEARLRDVFAELDGQGFDLIVLLCTGHFGRFRMATPFIEAQHAVDHFVQGVTYGIDRLGVLLPHRKQIEDFHGIPGAEPEFGYASPYSAESAAQLAEAGAALAGTGAIVMHCMGYSEAMRQAVMAHARRPVLLSRRMVAHAIDLMLS